MSITSLHFILFLVATLSVYYAFPKYQRFTLLAASIFFIILLDLQLFILISFFLFFVYSLYFLLSRQNPNWQRKLFLSIGVFFSLFFIWATKYYDFSLSILQRITPSVTFLSSSSINLLNTIGISFITFKVISTLVDRYKNKEKDVSVTKFFLHNTFFPEFLSGPIQRYVSFAPQITNIHQLNFQNILDGSQRIIMGLFKKLVIANSLAAYVDLIYASPEEFSSWNVLLAIYLFAFQLLFDFSGYTDIAIGIGKLFGIKIPENFNLPYLATSVRVFWRRWHMTLSSWFRDYLYIPIGGSRKGTPRTIINIFIVFLMTGIWHGASWNFIVWGLLHGSFITVELIVSKVFSLQPNQLKRFSTFISWLITFNLIVFSWILFRSNSVSQSIEILRQALSFSGSLSDIPTESIILLLGFGLGMLIYRVGFINKNEKIKILLNRIGLLIAVIGIAFFSVTSQTDFIYFKF